MVKALEFILDVIAVATAERVTVHLVETAADARRYGAKIGDHVEVRHAPHLLFLDF